MDRIIGFVGTGNMGQAMISKLVQSSAVGVDKVIASEIAQPLREVVREKYGIKVYESAVEVAKEADYIVLSVKPNVYEIVLKDIRDYVKDGATVISIGAGISSKFLKENVREGVKYLKVMPNTPAMVGEGMSAVSVECDFTKEEMDDILGIFNTLGKTEIVNEKLMDAVTAVSGSSPAYVYMMIEAMADAAVLEGMPRHQAYTFAAQAVLGSAKMVLETGIHPGALKDNVCSPGGTTIEAVSVLEEKGFRNAIIQAMRSCAKKSKEMSK